MADRRRGLRPLTNGTGTVEASLVTTRSPARSLVVPGLVVLATASFVEGYRSLDLLQVASPRPALIAWVALVAPVALWLTRPIARRSGPARGRAVLVRGSAVLVAGCGVLAIATPGRVTDLLFGGASVALAVAAVLVAWRTEVGTD